MDSFLCCPSCGAVALADDEFCESCGREVAAPRRRAREYVETDAGSAAGVSDRGLIHTANEDAMVVERAGRAMIVAVADGVSTSIAPDVAAMVAARVGADRLEAIVKGASSAGMAEALAAAQAAVAELEWQPAPGRDAPACTLVLACWDGSEMSLGWVGDSRAYWCGPDGVRQLTRDHSWAQEQVDAGRLTSLEASSDGRAHAITRWLGADSPGSPAAVLTFRPERSGRLIVCSDGLWNYAPSDDEMTGLVGSVAANASPIELARELTRYAVRRGGRDNVTVAVVDVDPANDEVEGTA